MPTGAEMHKGFDTALDFWRWWQEDPDADQKLACKPNDAIRETLMRQGYEEPRAETIAEAALVYVCYQRRMERIGA